MNHALRSLSLVLVAACGAPDSRTAEPAESPWAEAVALAEDGRKSEAIDLLEAVLAEEPGAAQSILLDASFEGGVREDSRFEAVVGRALFEGSEHVVTLCRDDEPGEWVEVTIEVVDASAEPLAGAQVFVFATDAEGRYHPTIEGESEPRLWGCTTTNDEGRCVVRTVRPGPYPGTRNPRHLHVRARHGDMRLATPGYIVFDDDPLLFEEGNEEPREEAPRIAMQPAVDGVARGTVTLPLN